MSWIKTDLACIIRERERERERERSYWLQDVLYQVTDGARGFLGSINGNKEIHSEL